MSKKTLDELLYWCEDLTDVQHIKLREQLKELFMEVIGEDEVRPESGPKRNGIDQGLRRTRNKLRAELRKAVEAM